MLFELVDRTFDPLHEPGFFLSVVLAYLALHTRLF